LAALLDAIENGAVEGLLATDVHCFVRCRGYTDRLLEILERTGIPTEPVADGFLEPSLRQVIRVIAAVATRESDRPPSERIRAGLRARRERDEPAKAEEAGKRKDGG
jgi:DNA invertase Pin-like site-specific DNA recombinase